MDVRMRAGRGVKVAVKAGARRAKAKGWAVTWRGMASKAGAAEPVKVLGASALGKVLRMREVSGERGATTAMVERKQEHAIRRRAQGEVKEDRGLKAEGSGRDKEGAAREVKARANKKERGETDNS